MTCNGNIDILQQLIMGKAKKTRKFGLVKKNFEHQERPKIEEKPGKYQN